MKRALCACFLIACGGETDPIVANDPPPPPAAAAAAPVASTPSSTPAPEQAAPAPASSSLPVDIDAYCAEKTNIPTRGSIQGDDYFWTEGAIDITSDVAGQSLNIRLRWPSKLTTEPKTGEKMRSDRYSYMTIDFEGELATGKATPTGFAHGGGGYDCTAHTGQGGDAAGGTPIPATLTITTRTDKLIEGTLEVPTDKGAQHLTFSAPIVPPAPASTMAVCCLNE